MFDVRGFLGAGAIKACGRVTSEEDGLAHGKTTKASVSWS